MLDEVINEVFRGELKRTYQATVKDSKDSFDDYIFLIWVYVLMHLLEI